jgi:hypothetical protein
MWIDELALVLAIELLLNDGSDMLLYLSKRITPRYIICEGVLFTVFISILLLWQ